MKGLFLDTNIIIDFLMDRQPFSEAATTIFTLAVKGKAELYIAASSFDNLYYIMKQSMGHGVTLKNLRKIASFVTILDVTQDIIKSALASDNTDFEDAIQYYTAQSNKRIEAIITRDRKGFKKSDLPVFTADEALSIIRS